MAAGLSSLEAVRRKIRSLQEQADGAEERAGRLQRELDEERALREQRLGLGKRAFATELLRSIQKGEGAVAQRLSASFALKALRNSVSGTSRPR
uniref:Uncharacterized protein n=1 Tax=Sphaerodactylus townsendi TaxID=933632 RepID=A0ACB8E4X8_9SAUR